MPVTDEQEATLHAQLAGRWEDHKRLLAEMDPAAARTGYTTLVTAAFSIAADRRFPRDVSQADVIDFVGDIRSRRDAADNLDARVAERLLMAVLTGAKADGIDARTSFQAQVVLLAGLIGDEQMAPEELDRFMLQARELADEWLVA